MEKGIFKLTEYLEKDELLLIYPENTDYHLIH